METTIQVNTLIDHTNLDENSSDEDIERLVSEAKEHNFNSICIRARRVKVFGSKYRCSATIDFPRKKFEVSNLRDINNARAKIGTKPISAKEQEAKMALSCGALELDPVLNVNQAGKDIKMEIRTYVRAMLEASQERPNETFWIKPIFSCELLTQPKLAETINIFAEMANNFKENNPDAKIKFAYKTSTGYVTANDNLDEVLKMQFTGTDLIDLIVTKLEHVDPNKLVHIKAAGGIRSRRQVDELVRAGKGRISHIGTSSGLDIIKG